MFPLKLIPLESATPIQAPVAVPVEGLFSALAAVLVDGTTVLLVTVSPSACVTDILFHSSPVIVLFDMVTFW